MAITSIESALAQYNENLDWNTGSVKAQKALEAVRYLIVNQPTTYSIAGRTVTKNLPHLEKESEAISTFIGVSTRSNGRRRVVGTYFADPAGSLS